MNAHEMIRTSVLGCRRVDLYTDPRPLSTDEQLRFDRMISRFECGEPLQYILGETEFLGLRFFVDQRVLIPRPETEIMVGTLLGILSSSKLTQNGLNILDIGTGSGCIAVSLVKHLMDCRCDAVDVSCDALEVGQKNAVAHGVDDRVKFYCCDMRKMQAQFSLNRYDVIISNPPYIPTGCLADLPDDVHREPCVALDGGEDGLVFYWDIIRQAAAVLKPDGLLVCEFWDGQENDIKALFDEAWSVEFFKDLSGAYRFFIARKAVEILPLREM